MMEEIMCNDAEIGQRLWSSLASDDVRIVIPDRPMPAIGEWFNLEVNNDVDPMDVVASAGFDPTDWKYLGPKFSGKTTYRVKLIRLGRVDNLGKAKDAVKKEDRRYRLLEGQAREAFKAKFPWHLHFNQVPVILGGSEWQDPNRCHRVATLENDPASNFWVLGFASSDLAFGEKWLWAVVDESA